MTDNPKNARDMSPAEYKKALAEITRPKPKGVWQPPKPQPIDSLSDAEYKQRLDALKRGYTLPPITPKTGET